MKRGIEGTTRTLMAGIPLRRDREPKLVVAPEKVEIFDIEQGSEDWFMLRLGMPTASHFADVMANGKDGGESKMRKRYLHRLCGEILTGRPATTFKSAAMIRGNEMEASARSDYEFSSPAAVDRVGFVRRTIVTDRFVGCSPDSLVGKDGVLEIKTMEPELIVELVESGRFPTEHRAQVHGSLWITGRQWCDLKIYFENMPISPTFRIERDDKYIREIAEAVEVFQWDLKKLVERMRNRGK